MAISGLQIINIGLPNESAGSDTLYTAFNKAKTNFATLFGNASPYNTFTGNTGITVNANSTLGSIDITNTGVTSLTAGTGIVLSNTTGAITISSNGGGNGGSGTVTSVGVQPVSSSRITVSGSPIVSSGTILVDLATSGVSAGTYTYPTMSVDLYGRVTSISSGASVGTVTSVGVTPGFGIQVTGSPITTNGNITILNTGVTRLNAGTGIFLTGSNGNITISTAVGLGTVTSVGLTSSTLTVSGGPITTEGTLSVDLPSTITLSGNITAGNLLTGGVVTATGNVTGANLVTGGVLSVTGNANIGNIGTSGLVIATGNVTGANLVTGGVLSVTGNANVGNIGTSGLVVATGNVTGGNIRTTGSIGYITGAGATVVQDTSRTNGVTINAITGAITLVSAAGSATFATFTVTNNKVAATDVIIVNQKSGTDLYQIFVTAVAASSFNITFATTGGTTTEQPVFNFAVIKGVTS